MTFEIAILMKGGRQILKGREEVEVPNVEYMNSEKVISYKEGKK